MTCSSVATEYASLQLSPLLLINWTFVPFDIISFRCTHLFVFIVTYSISTFLWRSLTVHLSFVMELVGEGALQV